MGNLARQLLQEFRIKLFDVFRPFGRKAIGEKFQQGFNLLRHGGNTQGYVSRPVRRAGHGWSYCTDRAVQPWTHKSMCYRMPRQGQFPGMTQSGANSGQYGQFWASSRIRLVFGRGILRGEITVAGYCYTAHAGQEDLVAWRGAYPLTLQWVRGAWVNT